MTFGLAITIAVLTLMDGSRVPSGGALTDKAYHLVAFAELVLPTSILRPAWWCPVTVGAFGFGRAIEVIQPAFGRSADWLDLLANGLGIVIGAGLGALMRRIG
jgi:glycopeptide antibiotics resistance protein